MHISYTSPAVESSNPSDSLSARKLPGGIMRTLVLTMACVSVLGVASADRGPVTQGGLTLSSTDLEHIQKDEQGREVSRVVQHFTADGFLNGATTWSHSFVGNQPSRTERETTNADGVVTGRFVEQRRYVSSRLDRIIREWTDSHGGMTRHEEAVYTRDERGNANLITTTVRDGARELIEVRYTVMTNIRGSFHSSDTSVFNADNVQTSRHRTEWLETSVERWSFDDADEVVRYENESLQKDAKGRTVFASADVFGSGRAKTGARERRMTYDGPNGAISLAVTTWFDASDRAIQRETVRYVHERGTTTRRVRWEHWSDSAE